MPKKIEFNFAAVAEQHRAICKEAAEKIHELLRMSAGAIVQIGALLLKVHSVLRDDAYQAFLKAEFGWSHNNAWHYEVAAKRFGEAGECLDNFHPSALRILSNSKTDPKAVEESLKRARKGEVIGRQVALKLLRKHQPAGKTHPALKTPLYHLRAAIKEVLEMELTAEDRRAIADELIALASQLRGNKPVGRQPAIIDDTDAEQLNVTRSRRRARTSPVPA